MKAGHTWWVHLGERIQLSLSLDYWNPLDAIEFRRSLQINRFSNTEVPFVSITIALLCIRLSWEMYV